MERSAGDGLVQESSRRQKKWSGSSGRLWDCQRWSLSCARCSCATARRRGHNRIFRGTPRRAGPAPGSVPTPGAPAPILNRGVPRTGRRRRAPPDRGARLEGLRQPSAPHRSSRAAPRSRLRSATRRLAPRRPPRPLSSNQSPGTPRARSVFGLSARGRPFHARFFAAARRTGPVGVQRRALRLSGPPAAALGGQNLVRLH